MQSDLSGVIGDNAELGKRVREGMTKLFATFPAGTILKGGGLGAGRRETEKLRD
jgi:hypothetical protein